MSIKQYLLIPHLAVHNANGLSSPFTIGFPAVTAFLGAAHALQRKLNTQGLAVTFSSVGIVSHQANLQSYKGDNDFVHSIVGTANPLDKSGSRSAFIEEARIHLDVSLIFDVSGIDSDNHDQLIASASHILHSQMRLAGGDIQDFQPLELHTLSYDDTAGLQRLQRKLMPGYALIERRELMQQAMNEGQDSIDAMLDYLAIHNHCEPINSDQPDKVQWRSGRKQINGKSAGWIVPIATGFHGISELGQAKNQRDEHTPHRFAESVVTLGEFIMPHRLQSIEQLLWHYQVHQDQSLYLCQQHVDSNNQEPETVADEFANL